MHDKWHNSRMTEITRRFGKVIRSGRESRGLSQESLAEIADLNRNYIGKIERNLAVPSLETMQKLADALNERLSSLIAQCEYDHDVSK